MVEKNAGLSFELDRLHEFERFDGPGLNREGNAAAGTIRYLSQFMHYLQKVVCTRGDVSNRAAGDERRVRPRPLLQTERAVCRGR